MSTAENRLPGDLSHLERLIDTWAKSDPEQALEISPGRMTTQRRLRRLVGITAIAGALDGLRDKKGTPRFGIKGGSAMELRFGFVARTSRDLDAAFRGDLDEALILIAESLDRGWNNFHGVLGVEEEIVRANVKPKPVRVPIKLRYKTKPFMTIALEIAAAEGRSMDDPEILTTAIGLSPIQIDEPGSIALLPMRYQIAQKLHACTEDVGNPPNDRARDIADLMMLREFGVSSEDFPEIKAACQEIFAERDQHPWPPVVTNWPGWDLVWRALRKEEGIAAQLDEAIDEVQNLVAEIDNSK
jgi:hypothetical protein